MRVVPILNATEVSELQICKHVMRNTSFEDYIEHYKQDYEI